MAISKATITRLNNKFKAASAAEKRVLIAKDVIAQVNAKKYIPKSVYSKVISRLRPELDFQSNFDKVKCECCGVGSCFISLVRFTNNANIFQVDRAFHSGESISHRLEDYFSEKQLALIEFIFERHTTTDAYGNLHTSIGGQWNADVSEREMKKLEKVIPAYAGTPKKRLLMIMENIVRNNGTFKP